MMRLWRTTSLITVWPGTGQMVGLSIFVHYIGDTFGERGSSLYLQFIL